MYYVSLIVAIAVAFFAGRFCVSVAAGIERRWLRRLVFWLVVFPSVSTVCLYATMTFGDDMILLRLPGLFIGVFLPTTVFAVTFMISAFRGFKANPKSQERRACSWNDGRKLIVLTTLLGCSLFAYDWQLKNELLQLKETTLAEWRKTPQVAIPDDQNAASEFLSLGEFHEVLDVWHTKAQARFGEEGFERDINSNLFFSTIPNSPDAKAEDVYAPETLYVETDFSDEWFIGLKDCEGAFQKIRDGAVKPHLALIRRLEYPTEEQFESEFELLGKTLDLFKINLLAVAARGDLATAYRDVAVLLTTARHFESDITGEVQRFGTFARLLARDAIQHLLYLEPQPPAEFLRPLIDEKHNPRYRLPELMNWETALIVVRKCDAYLDLLEQDERDSMWDLNVMNRFPAFLSSRLAMAGDEMPRLRNRFAIYTRIAERWEDTSVTGDTLLKELIDQWPPDAWSGGDNRDLTFYATNFRYDIQQSINLMIAATLFQIQTGEFPATISDLVPRMLSAIPFSLRDGNHFSVQPFNRGLIVCSSDEVDKAAEVASNPNSINFAEDFGYGSTFLGPAYRLAHIREVPQLDEPTNDP